MTLICNLIIVFLYRPIVFLIKIGPSNCFTPNVINGFKKIRQSKKYYNLLTVVFATES